MPVVSVPEPAPVELLEPAPVELLPPVEEKPDPIMEVLHALVKDTPQGGALVQIQFRDRPGDFIRAVLEHAGISRPTAAQQDAYMHLMAAGQYNSSGYGTTSTSIQFPARWLVPGLGIGLRAAWLPRNMDALDCYLRGQIPTCTVDARTGAALTPATAYGLVYAPPVDLIDGEITTSEYSWDDGSSALDPPAILFTKPSPADG